MRRCSAIVAVVILCGGFARAQQPLTPEGMTVIPLPGSMTPPPPIETRRDPATRGPARPPPQAPPANAAPPPLSGAEIESRLRAQGYSVDTLRQQGGEWTVQAWRDGQPVMLSVDGTTGRIASPP